MSYPAVINTFLMNFFSNKKILITGGTGHLGSAIAHALVHQMNVPAGMYQGILPCRLAG